MSETHLKVLNKVGRSPPPPPPRQSIRLCICHERMTVGPLCRLPSPPPPPHTHTHNNNNNNNNFCIRPCHEACAGYTTLHINQCVLVYIEFITWCELYYPGNTAAPSLCRGLLPCTPYHPALGPSRPLRRESGPA